MANKVTKIDNFNTLLTLADVQANPSLVAFIKHEIELLEKKNANRSTKPTANQILNAEIAKRIPTLLEKDRWYRLTEIKDMIPELADSNGTQRIAVICKTLEQVDKALVKMIDKRVVYYALADTESTED